MGKNQQITGTKRIVLTGGHAGSTAYAVVQKLQIRHKGKIEINWIGAKHAMEGKSDETFEYKMLPKLGVKFHPIYTGRVQRKFTRRTIPSLIKIPIGFVHALYLLLKIRPTLVVSFGGYAAYPVVMVSWILSKKIVSHEQTSTVGLVTEKTARFVDKIALARESSKKYLPKEKCVVIGNPIPAETTPVKPRVIGNPPIIFVTGGSRGSVPINTVVLESINEMLNIYKVIHQTGSADYERIMIERDKLNQKLRKRYEVYEILKPDEWDKILSTSDVVVSRSGANTISAIIYMKIPALLIPIQKTHRDEQKKNAKYAKDFGIATILDQDDLIPEVLLSELAKTVNNWDKIIIGVKDKPSPDVGAATRFVDILDKYI